MPKIKVFIADDHDLLREVLKQALERQPDIAVIGEAGDGINAVKNVEKLKPDAVIMDLNMPGIDGFEAVNRISSGESGAKIVILSIYHHNAYVVKALSSGAKGYLLKPTSGEDVAEAVREVYSGRYYLSSKINANFIYGLLRKSCKKTIITSNNHVAESGTI